MCLQNALACAPSPYRSFAPEFAGGISSTYPLWNRNAYVALTLLLGF